MDGSLINDVLRDRYVERCKQRALGYLDQGDLKKAAALFVSDMNARRDCELPHHLAALGTLLLLGDSVSGHRPLRAKRDDLRLFNYVLGAGDTGDRLDSHIEGRRSVSRRIERSAGRSAISFCNSVAA